MQLSHLHVIHQPVYCLLALSGEKVMYQTLVAASHNVKILACRSAILSSHAWCKSPSLLFPHLCTVMYACYAIICTQGQTLATLVDPGCINQGGMAWYHSYCGHLKHITSCKYDCQIWDVMLSPCIKIGRCKLIATRTAFRKRLCYRNVLISFLMTFLGILCI